MSSLGIQRTTIHAVAKWPRDTPLSGVVTKVSGDAAFVKFGNGTATCSKEGVLHNSKAIKEGEKLQVRLRHVDVPRNRITLELAAPGAELCCYRCGTFGHRVRECPMRPEPLACYRCGAEGHRVKECDSSSDACSVASSRSGRPARRRRHAKEEPPAPAEPVVIAADAVEVLATVCEGNAKERRRQRRAAAHQKHAEETERHIVEMLRSVLTRKGVSTSSADTEETLRAKLDAALATARAPSAFCGWAPSIKLGSLADGPPVAPLFRVGSFGVPPPPIKFGSFSSDGIISASLVDTIASCPEAPAALLRRLSSAGAA